MTQYLLLIQNNQKIESTPQEWEQFFVAAKSSGTFSGGSEIGAREVLGDSQSAQSTAHIGGYMRFDSDDKETLIELLKLHPVVLHGGSVELCELPES